MWLFQPRASPSRPRDGPIISAGFEIIFAFCWFEDVGARFESAHQAGDGPLGESVMAIQSFEAHQL
jgi:hypothetical protein